METNFFTGKRITLMGLGLLGRGVGDAVYMARHGAQLIVTDLKTEAELTDSVKALVDFPNVQLVLGEHRLEDFRDRDLIIRAANVPHDSVHLLEAQRNDIPITQSVALFVRLLHAYKKHVGKADERYLVGVTGSKGKTTVTHLIGEMLVRGLPERRVRLGGNVQGISTLSFLDDVQPDDVFVLELDSWQLQSFDTSDTAVHVGVFTTFLPDHMNYYKGDMDRYFNDKANIFCVQDDAGVCFVGANVMPWIEKHQGAHAGRVRPSERRAFARRSPSLLGEHNTENIGLAASAAHAFSVSDAIIEEVIATFSGVAGRLQYIGTHSGIRYYNDTTATMPDATIAALKALASDKNIVLIAGGADKSLDVSELATALPLYCRALILLKGSGTEKMRPYIMDSDFETVREVSSMEEAVREARASAHKGDTILLSPAFASFGMFVNEYDRGDQFIRTVMGMTASL